LLSDFTDFKKGFQRFLDFLRNLFNFLASTWEWICDNLALRSDEKSEKMMAMKMKSARFYEVGEPLRIDKIPVPRLAPGDVLVEINNLG
jgi:hypothetical protein